MTEIQCWQEAIKCYWQLVQIDPNNYIYSQVLGDAMFNSHQYLGAIDIYQRMVELDPTGFWPYYQLGKAYFKVDMFEEASACFDTARSIDNTRFDCYELAALSCEFSGLRNQATKYWQCFTREKKDSALAAMFIETRGKLAQLLSDERDSTKRLLQERENFAHENELLSLQLHQAQEDLQSYLLKVKNQEQAIIENKLVIERHGTLERDRDELAQQLQKAQLYAQQILEMKQDRKEPK